MASCKKTKGKIKIIATIGPASSNRRTVYNMICAGMGIARMNMKYADKRKLPALISTIKQARKKANHECKILIDINSENLIPFVKTLDFDYLALAFTETPEQIERIKRAFLPKKIKLISKIESKKGIKNIDKIINHSWGVMVARGDLGKNIPFERLPVFQKLIIRKCNRKGKIAITATEMLLSMLHSKIPQRSESSDVANAVLDGSDMVMLSEETAIGEHPILVVKTMRKIIDETETWRCILKTS